MVAARSVRLALALLACATAVWAGADEEALQKRVAELRPDVEAVLGHPLGEPIDVVLLADDEYAAMAARGLAALRAEIEDGPRGDALAALCDEEAAGLSLLGTVHPHPDTVLLSQSQRDAIATGGDDLRDLLLVLEMIRVDQRRRHDLAAVLGRPRSMEQLLVRVALLAGHALHVTRAVAARRGVATELDRLVGTLQPKRDDVVDPVARQDTEWLDAFRAFTHVDGEAFWGVVSGKLGGLTAEQRLFAAPPSTVRQLTHPEEYLEPRPAAVRPYRAALLASRLLSGAGFASQVMPLPPRALAVWLGDGEAAQRAAADLDEGCVLLSSLDGTTVGVVLARTATPEAATALGDALVAMVRRLDQLYGTDESTLRVLNSSYEPFTVTGAKGTIAQRRLLDRGDEARFDETEVVLARGRYALRVAASGLDHGVLRVPRLAGRILALLDALERVGPTHPLAMGLGEGDVIGPLREALGSTDARLRLAAVLTAAEGAEDFVALDDEPNADVRVAVALTTGKGDVGDEDWEVREALLDALAFSEPDATAWRAALDRALQDAHPVLRLRAWWFLWEQEGQRTLGLKHVAAALRDSSAPVRRAAAAWISSALAGTEEASTRAEELVPLLRRLLFDSDDGVREEAANGLHPFGPAAADALEPLLGLLADSTAAVRLAAVTTIGAMGDEATPAVPVLLRYFDRAPEHRVAVLWTIESLGRAASEAESRLRALLSHIDADVRHAAAIALFAVSGADDERLVAGLREAVRDGSYWNCVSAAYDLAALVRTDALPDLIARLADRDADVQVGVAEALGLMGAGARAALPALRRLAEDEGFPYRDVVDRAIEQIEQ